MFGLIDCGKKKQGKLGVGNVLVLVNLHGCYQQEGINQWKTKTRKNDAVNKPKQELKGEPRSALTSQTRPPMKTNICQWQATKFAS